MCYFVVLWYASAFEGDAVGVGSAVVFALRFVCVVVCVLVQLSLEGVGFRHAALWAYVFE